MSAGFNFQGQTHWGTNGAVEAYLEGLADIAEATLGPDHRLALVLRQEKNAFFTGAVVFLDGLLTEPGDCERFLSLLTATTDHILQNQAFTPLGLDWIATEIRALQLRLVTTAASPTKSHTLPV